MLVEVGDALFRVETHHFFKVGHGRFIVGRATKGKPDCARPRLFLNPGA
jgi:hypothetical protein